MAKSLKLGLLVAIPLLLATCKKEPVKMPDTPVEPDLIITLSKDSVMCGDSLQIRIVCKKNVQMGFSTMKPGKIISGTWQGPFDKTFSSGKLYFTTKLVSNTGFGETFTVPIKVYEKAKDSERTRLLTQKPWKLVSLSTVLLDGSFFADWPLSEEEKSYSYYYYTNHRMESLKPGTKSNIDNVAGGWYFSGNYLIMGDPAATPEFYRDSIVITETELIRYNPSAILTDPITPCWYKYTYHH